MKLYSLVALRHAAGRCLTLLAALFSIFIPSACNHREFLYDEPSGRATVEVMFDWSADPQASPRGMTVYFFRSGSKSRAPIAYDFKGRNGGTVSLTPGVYSAICHNSDSDRHGFVDQDSYDDFGIRLNDHRNAGNLSNSSAVAPHSGDERIAHFPDSMWVASIPMFIIEAPAPTDTHREIITFAMQPVVHHYTFLIHNPLNFNNSISVSASLSGMASTVHPGRSATGDETVTHLFNMTPTPDGGLFGEILTFGHCGSGDINSRDGGDDSPEKPHVLVVRASLSDGQNWTSSHDVTDQIHGSRVPDCVIRLDSIAFPKPTGGSGFSPSVGGWIGSQENVGM
ncbi:MAG: DUF5119 domain-containing protein [Muribaculaceae bacterium]|nr:DUF5119 domain-containing protein [Muribaculaceae bacterium]